MTKPTPPTKRTRNKTPFATIPEAARRKKGQVKVSIRTTRTELAALRAQHGQPGDSDATIVKRAAGLISTKDA
jgi:hypothetical protein